MSEEIQDTSEMRAEKGDCAETCACLDCISRVVQRVDGKIARMDTTGLSLGTFRIVNSLLFCQKDMLFQDEERTCQMDDIYMQGIDIISKLLMEQDKIVGFMLLDRTGLNEEICKGFFADWNRFFLGMIAEKKHIHTGQDYKLRLFKRIIGSSCSFILEKVSTHSDL